jgi:hypothetical protein
MRPFRAFQYDPNFGNARLGDRDAPAAREPKNLLDRLSVRAQPFSEMRQNSDPLVRYYGYTTRLKAVVASVLQKIEDWQKSFS